MTVLIKFRFSNEPSWKWDTTRSTRYNQDAQRDREMRIFRDLVTWYSFSAYPGDALAVSVAGSSSSNQLRGTKQEKVRKDFGFSTNNSGSYFRLEVEFKEKFCPNEKSQSFIHSRGVFRAKVQAISRLKLRLRNRTAFSATR